MPVWATTPVDKEPHLLIDRWLVFEATDGSKPTRHLVGRIKDGEGRVSSAIRDWDPAIMTFTTRSGRRYQVSNNSAMDPEGMYVWTRWQQINNITSFKDVTEEYFINRDE